MSPEYFHNRLTFCEAADYIEGLNRRYRASWEQTRLIVNVQARCAGNKKDVLKDFWWEKAAKMEAQRPPTPEELEELKSFAKKIEKARNG